MTATGPGGRLLAGLREARWLNRTRVRAYAAILLVMSTFAAMLWVALADGLIDRRGKPIGTDFAAYYAAGRLALAGRPEAAFSPAAHYAEQQATFAPVQVPAYGWLYPPTFLLVATAIAALPYGAALASWMAASLALYLRALAPVIAGHGATGWLLVLAYPGVFVNLGHGQNGFLVAALLGGGLLALPARPIAAGVLFGLLSFKPQFGLLLPLVLLATGNWRALAAAALSALALAALSYAAFGAECWRLFMTDAAPLNVVALETGMAGWHKLQSLFAALRQWGAPIWLAYGGQAVLGVAVAVLVVRLWLTGAAHDLKAAALAAGAVLASPHVFDYDLMLLALPIAALARAGLASGFRAWEKSILVAAFVLPMLSRTVAQTTTIPLGVIVPALLLWAIARRARPGYGQGAERL